MAASIPVAASTFDLPRVALRADAALTGTCGVLLLAAARPISSFLGLDRPLALAAVGALSLPCAALMLVWSANRRPVERRAVLACALVNVVGVIGIAAALLVGRPELTTGGSRAVALLAAVVAVVAGAQVRALRGLA